MADVHPLTAFRKRQDPPLTLEGLADLLGVSKATVSRWESGGRNPDPAIVPKISKATGIPASKLRPDLAEVMAPPPITDLPF